MFERLQFPDCTKMVTIARYPEDLTFLQWRLKNLGGQRNPTDFIDFNFVVLQPRSLPPSIMYINAKLHLVDPGVGKAAWVAAERCYWRDDGPLPSKMQIIAEVMAAEKTDLLVQIREMSKW